MVKLIEVIGRRPDLTHAYFLKHLSTTHLEVVDRVPEFRNRVRQYVQNHLFVDPNELAAIHGLSISTNADGLIEVWWDRFSDIMGAFQEPRYLEIIRPDELAFGDVPGAWGVTTQETLVMERNGFSGLIKLFIFLKRSDRTPHAAFRSRWQAIREDQLSPATAFRAHVGRFVENWVSEGVRFNAITTQLSWRREDRTKKISRQSSLVSILQETAAMKTQQAGRWPAIIFFLAIAPHAMAAPPP